MIVGNYCKGNSGINHPGVKLFQDYFLACKTIAGLFFNCQLISGRYSV